MTQATRIDNDEALRLAHGQLFNTKHVLVIGDKRHRAEKRDGYCAFWYGSQPQDWVSAAQLEPMLKLGVAHVELETPSVFEDEAFKEWTLRLSDNNQSGVKQDWIIWSDGAVWYDANTVLQVPIDRIPEAARHINALLALGDGK